MNMKFVAIASSLLLALSMSAQTHQRNAKTRQNDKTFEIANAYIDSLNACKASIDSVFDSHDRMKETCLEGQYYRLFIPLTFYHDIINKTFSIDGNTTELDNSLLGIYMSRPDLVQSTQSQIDRVGPILEVSPKVDVPDVDMVDRVSPKVKDEDVTSPINVYVEKPNFWKFSGDYGLQLFQNYVSSNWYKGGESNYSMLATVTLQANYNNKQRFRWDNKLEMRLGLQNSRGDTLHTVRASEDLLRYTSKVGIQASKRWYYTFQFIATTQFMRGLRSNDPNVYSRFLAPLYVNPSLGMDYNVNWFHGKFTGSVHLAPIAYSLTYVRDKALSTRFGLEDGRHTKSDFGSELTADLAWQIAKDIRWKTRLYGYTTYKRVLVEWENTFTFVVNKYISSNVFVYPRFDDAAKKDDKYGFFQMKEYISLGFSYGF